MRFFCASSAACIAEIATYPMDALITRLQLQRGYQHGLASMFVTICKNEGPLVLFKGATPAVVRQIVTGGFGVGMYPILRKFYCGDNEAPKLYQRIMAGSTCGTLAQAIASPLDVIKVRLQSQARAMGADPTLKPQYRGMAHTFTTIYRCEGVQGLFLGLTPSLIRAAAQYGAGTATYDQTKSFFVGGDRLADIPSTHLLCSLFSGFATACAGCPADVIKTRMIAHAQGSGSPYRSTLDCIMQTVKTERLRGLYKGFLPTWMRLAPWQMVFFVGFEQISLLVTGHTFQTK